MNMSIVSQVVDVVKGI